MQCLANVLKQDTICKGVVINQETLKFSMFADNVLLFLSGTNDQFFRIIIVLQEFSNHNNCKINLSNVRLSTLAATEIVWISLLLTNA